MEKKTYMCASCGKQWITTMDEYKHIFCSQECKWYKKKTTKAKKPAEPVIDQPITYTEFLEKNPDCLEMW